MKKLIVLLSMLFVLNAYSQSYDGMLLRKHISEFKEHEKECQLLNNHKDDPPTQPVPFPKCKCLGVELLECGNFECENNWTTTGGWSITNNVAKKVFGGIGTNRINYEFIKPLLSGFCYKLQFDILNYVAQDFVIAFNDPPQLTIKANITSNGHYIYLFNLTRSNNVYNMIFEAVLQTELQVDNVSLIPCCCN